VEARGLKTCLGFKGDSTAAYTEYIAAINASASQLCPVHPMSVAVSTLLSLHLSEASGQRDARTGVGWRGGLFKAKAMNEVDAERDLAVLVAYAGTERSAAAPSQQRYEV
jgi:hypothetical protein